MSAKRTSGPGLPESLPWMVGHALQIMSVLPFVSDQRMASRTLASAAKSEFLLRSLSNISGRELPRRQPRLF